MTDATILIPTFRHAALLPYSVRSALDQEDVSVEIFVVGDGVEDRTREALEPFHIDSRVRFFDFPKSSRHGEPYRHELLLREATGKIVCYVADDDLLLPQHAAEMCRLLEDADFAHGPSMYFDTNGDLHYRPFDLGEPPFLDIARSGDHSIGLTESAHTLDAYRRLPHGWRTTPREIYSDHYMWLQWLELPGFRGVAGRRPTHLHFPDPLWGELDDSEREAALAEWFRRSREPGFADELQRMLGKAARRAADAYFVHARILERSLDAAQSRVQAAESSLQTAESLLQDAELNRNAVESALQAADLRRHAAESALQAAESRRQAAESALDAVESTRTWRLRGRLRKVAPLRALLARRPEGR